MEGSWSQGRRGGEGCGRTIWIVRGEEEDESSSSSSADPPQQFRERKKAAILPLKVVGSGEESNCLDIFRFRFKTILLLVAGRWAVEW